MIIGNGDIGSVLQEVDRDDRLFFASGVSNSQETDDDEYWRETRLLLDQDRDQHLVYFSSLAIFYSNTKYIQHKRETEEFVKHYFAEYTIIRIGNITWGSNPHTLINHFRNAIKNNQPLHIEDTYRFIVDKEEFLYWISLIPDWSCEMNIPGKRMKVRDIVKEYCYGNTRIYS